MKNVAINSPTNLGRQGNTGDNSVLPQLAVTCKIQAECSYQTLVQVDSEVLKSSFVHLMNVSAVNLRLRKAAKRYIKPIPIFQN